MPGKFLRGECLKKAEVYEDTSTPAAWVYSNIVGRLVELSTGPGSTPLSLGFNMVHQVQQQGDLVAWVGSGVSEWYGPDVFDVGIDLEQLALIRLATDQARLRAADHLLRSGAFGLVLVDLCESSHVHMAAMTRLSSLCIQHHSSLIFVNQHSARTLGSLISLRVKTDLGLFQNGRWHSQLQATKDKRQGPGWSQAMPLQTLSGLQPLGNVKDVSAPPALSVV